MHRLPPLLLAGILLAGCAVNPFKTANLKPEARPTLSSSCPSWRDASKGRKAKLADEVDAAPADAVWPDVVLADLALKDQLVAAGCYPVK